MQIYTHVAETIRTHLDAGEIRQAEIIAHSLKGASASLGAGPLSITADTLERALGEGHRDVVENTLLHFESILENLCRGLSMFFTRTPGRNHRNRMEPAVEGNEFLRLLEKLHSLLGKESSRAESVAQELLSLSAGLGREKELAKILAVIEDVEFSSAQKLVETLKAQLEEEISIG